MKRLYARFVLWLIRPALDEADRQRFDRFRKTLRNAENDPRPLWPNTSFRQCKVSSDAAEKPLNL